MTRYEEAKHERFEENYFKSQREIPNGRNFLWDTYRFRTKSDIDSYRDNFDRIFPNAPGVGI